jgi:phenylacetic acid degradation operon negative regulatory protein
MPNMTARSVVLSVLLGAHPAHASASELIRLTADFGIKETTLRVALTRMVGAGDLIRSADGYRLSDRLLARQRRQDEAMRPQVRAWQGFWHIVIVTSVGDDARTRAALRTAMHHKRFGELREGVWMRPDNLDLDLDPETDVRVRVLKARDDAPAQLADQLWDLPGWSRAGHRLLDEMAPPPGASGAPDIPARFVVAAAMVRHLLTDPMLPAELLPAEWPGARLRAAYHDFATELAGRREPPERQPKNQLLEAT